ncbi:hypothetical protein HDU84_006666 [Entophlyctis sp. JEL0112]|nr:hypothetical protein HDU84_006666 [Entophlyctis sp. JEL0112]
MSHILAATRPLPQRANFNTQSDESALRSDSTPRTVYSTSGSSIQYDPRVQNGRSYGGYSYAPIVHPKPTLSQALARGYNAAAEQGKITSNKLLVNTQSSWQAASPVLMMQHSVPRNTPAVAFPAPSPHTRVAVFADGPTSTVNVYPQFRQSGVQSAVATSFPSTVPAASIFTDRNAYNALDGTRIHPPQNEPLPPYTEFDELLDAVLMPVVSEQSLDANQYARDGTRVHPAPEDDEAAFAEEFAAFDWLVAQGGGGGVDAVAWAVQVGRRNRRAKMMTPHQAPMAGEKRRYGQFGRRPQARGHQRHRHEQRE